MYCKGIIIKIINYYWLKTILQTQQRKKIIKRIKIYF